MNFKKFSFGIKNMKSRTWSSYHEKFELEFLYFQDQINSSGELYYKNIHYTVKNKTKTTKKVELT